MAGRDDIFSVGDLEERMRRANQRELPKRFYKEASIRAEGGSFVPVLDGRPIRTPGKRVLQVPTSGLAQAIANEWQAQEKTIDPGRMPLTRLVNTIIDRIGMASDDVRAEIVAYAGSDLLCYRAEGPQSLVLRQNETWTPVLRWAEATFGARMVLIEGVMPAKQPEEAIDRIANAVGALDGFALGAAASMTNLTGSALLALAVVHGALSAEAAWAAAHVDEDFQIAQWGEDGEARARRDARWRDMEAAGALLRHL